MAKHHSTISRRDFLKALGLGGSAAAFTAYAGTVPGFKFNDLDEVMASPLGLDKRPSWVKHVDKPTAEIDWSLVKRFDFDEVMWCSGMIKALGPEQANMVLRQANVNKLTWVAQGKPGANLRDVAMNSCGYQPQPSFIGPQTSPTPDDLDAPRYEGTPEESNRLVTTFLRLHGASHVGFIELDTETTEKLVYAYDSNASGISPGRGPRIDILDVDAPEENTEKGYRVLPKKARWVIIYTLRMDDEQMLRPLTLVGGRVTGAMYNLKTMVQAWLQNFVRTLGYMCLGQAASYNGLIQATACGALAGLGELSRVGHLITPEYGLMQRVFVAITDLPLAPGKPIDFGLHKFCRVCKKCADYCPARAISPATEPTWDTGGKPWRGTGVKRWMLEDPRCVAYYRMMGNCSTCFAVCPYSHRSKASWNAFMRRSVATNSGLDRFFRKADDFFYGAGPRKDIEAIWDMLDLPPWGYV